MNHSVQMRTLIQKGIRLFSVNVYMESVFAFLLCVPGCFRRNRLLLHPYPAGDFLPVMFRVNFRPIRLLTYMDLKFHLFPREKSHILCFDKREFAFL